MSQFISEIGKRIDLELNVLFVSQPKESQFGLWNTNICETPKGDRVIYHGKLLHPQKKYQVRATIKQHRIFGNKQTTVINRPKIQKVSLLDNRRER